jgi:hypothetical protein
MVRAFIESAEYRERFFGRSTGNQLAPGDEGTAGPISRAREILNPTLRYIIFGNPV